MLCPHCGEESDGNNDRMCVRCGNLLDGHPPAEPWLTDRRMGKLLIWFGVIGWILLMIAASLAHPSIPLYDYGHAPTVLDVLSLIGLGLLVMVVWGFALYTRSKGYHWALGLISLIPLLAWIILVALPDRHSDRHRPDQQTRRPPP